MSICLVDTSIFCELLDVPGKCQHHQTFLKALEKKQNAGEKLLLPMTTILETGNHIGQNGDGTLRRKTAHRFIRLVDQAIDGHSPFVPTPFPAPESLRGWLTKFPEWVKRSDSKGKGSGLGDLTIVEEWTRQCQLHPKRRVYIWSLDEHLSSYDRHP